MGQKQIEGALVGVTHHLDDTVFIRVESSDKTQLWGGPLTPGEQVVIKVKDMPRVTARVSEAPKGKHADKLNR
jgi:hypothetical protein